MWNGKKKAITFSFDDGATQDIRLIEILNKYGLKGTFNLNSGLLGREGVLNRNGKTVSFNKVRETELKSIYRGHEIAVHTLTHPNLTMQEDEEVVRQIEEDRQALSKLCDYEVIGMAYPCGDVNNDERVAKLIKERTGVKYARTITSTGQFDKQSNLFRFNPSVYYIDKDLDAVAERFLTMQADTPQLLYIWGHSFELDAEYITWENFQSFCEKIAGKADIFYGTNKEVLFGDE